MLRKLIVLTIPPFIKNWITNFLTNRPQIIKLFNRCSLMLEVNSNIAQGSNILAFGNRYVVSTPNELVVQLIR